ncbi:MAG TPA: hypothetical protein VFW45_08385 [Candidatus Polarisedimenticolia bacterium]|nr:hypothetical protein [Candidatus Polarisedimenticolia bacterium]
MLEASRFLLVPLLGAAGWVLATRLPRASAILTLAAALGLLAIWSLGLASGLFGLPLGIHRRLAQILVMSAWVAAPFATGTFVSRGVVDQENRELLGALTVVLSLILVMGASFTGMMGPTHGALGSGNSSRFMVLHLIALPLLSGLGLAAWAYLAWRSRES